MSLNMKQSTKLHRLLVQKSKNKTANEKNALGRTLLDENEQYIHKIN